jgi:hypothetical protein
MYVDQWRYKKIPLKSTWLTRCNCAAQVLRERRVLGAPVPALTGSGEGDVTPGDGDPTAAAPCPIGKGGRREVGGGQHRLCRHILAVVEYIVF